MTECTHDTQTHDSINTLLQNGFFEGIPRSAEMPANAAIRAITERWTVDQRWTFKI